MLIRPYAWLIFILVKHLFWNVLLKLLDSSRLVDDHPHEILDLSHHILKQSSDFVLHLEHLLVTILFILALCLLIVANLNSQNGPQNLTKLSDVIHKRLHLLLPCVGDMAGRLLTAQIRRSWQLSGMRNSSVPSPVYIRTVDILQICLWRWKSGHWRNSEMFHLLME